MNKNILIIVLVLIIIFGGLAALGGGREGQEGGERMEVAAVPDSAFGPQVPQDKGYLVEEIKDGLYYITEGTYQVMFLTTGEGVIMG